MSEADRRAYRGGDLTPLAIAARDPVLRADGLSGDTLGVAMDYFEMTDEEAHQLLCDCHYMGSLTGHSLVIGYAVLQEPAVSSHCRACGTLKN